MDQIAYNTMKRYYIKQGNPLVYSKCWKYIFIDKYLSLKWQLFIFQSIQVLSSYTQVTGNPLRVHFVSEDEVVLVGYSESFELFL